MHVNATWFRSETFHTKCKIENPSERSAFGNHTQTFGRYRERIHLGVRADRSNESAYAREKKDVPFVLANGQEVTRSVGFAIIRLDKFFTIDEVVFAEPGDLQLLGARTLEGLNLTGRAYQASACRSRSSSRRLTDRLARVTYDCAPHATDKINTTTAQIIRCVSVATDSTTTPLASSARFCSRWDLRETRWRCYRSHVSSVPARARS